MSTIGRGRAGGNGHERRGWELLTVDELINRIVSKARSRGGRLFLTLLGLAVASIIVVIPLTRSAPAYSPAAQPPVAYSVPVISTAPSRTTLPTLPLGLFDSHTPTSATLPTTTTSSSSTSTSTTSSTSTSTTTVVPATVPPRTTPVTQSPGPPDTGVGVPVGG